MERSEGATNGFQAVPRILLCLPYFWLLVPGLPALHVSVQLHGKCQLQLPLFNSYRYAPKPSAADPSKTPPCHLDGSSDNQPRWA
jgi:hypothetical protein